MIVGGEPSAEPATNVMLHRKQPKRIPAFSLNYFQKKIAVVLRKELHCGLETFGDNRRLWPLQW